MKKFIGKLFVLLLIIPTLFIFACNQSPSTKLPEKPGQESGSGSGSQNGQGSQTGPTGEGSQGDTNSPGGNNGGESEDPDTSGEDSDGDCGVNPSNPNNSQELNASLQKMINPNLKKAFKKYL